MKVIIAGGRDFNDYKLLYEKCLVILMNQTDVEIVSGGAKGADKLGERFAKRSGYKITQFLPDYAKYGTYAPIVRNKEMALYGDALIAFWNGISTGTENMINNARKQNLKVRVIMYNQLN